MEHKALAYVKDSLGLGRQRLFHVSLETPEHEWPQDLVKLVNDLLLGLFVVDLQVEPLEERTAQVTG